MLDAIKEDKQISFNYLIYDQSGILIKRKDIKATTLGSNFIISSHINNHVYMFSSNVITAKIEIFQEWAITYIFDWFSKNARVVYQNNKTYAYIKSNEDAFI